MPHRTISRRAAAALACAAAISTVLPPHPAGAHDASGEQSAPPTTVAPPTTIADNVFVPANRDLDECISSIPKPDCGSTGRGGWRQTVVFAVMLAGMVAIGVRIAFSLRRRDRRDPAHP